jgi:cell division protein ZapE
LRDQLLEDWPLDEPGADEPPPALSPVEWYRQFSNRPGFQPDVSQHDAIGHLQRLYEQLLDWKAYRYKPLMKAFGRRRPPRGLYFHGGVGRGKSLLMDAFYSNLPYRRKRRVHFHHFMQQIHRALTAQKGEADPLQGVAERVAKRVRVLCFDEFHVSDIADAMILARLLKGLFENGVVFVMTSNYHPDGLYPNGLQRNQFVPAIALLKENLDVVTVDGQVDYRLRALEKIEVYHHPLGPVAKLNLERAFDKVSEADEEAGPLTVAGRRIQCVHRSPGIVWFEFKEICGSPRSQADYLEIAREHHTVLVSDVPQMSAQQESEARRFTWLVDVFYDHRVKLVISAEVPPEALYLSGSHANEFHRTVSRLQEMQSRDYLGLAHIS